MTTALHPRRAEDQPRTAPSSPSRALPVVMVLLGVGAVLTALLGPLGLGLIEYHASGGATMQVRGGDVAALVLVGPVSLAAASLLRRRHRAGPALALAPASYGLYMYTQLAISGDVLRYDGTSERFFPLFWALIVLSGAALVLAGRALAVDPAVPPFDRRPVRVTGWYLIVVAFFLVAGLHLPGLLDAWRAAPQSTEYLADPNVFWVVKVMDLAFVVPVLVTVGVGLLRSRGWALVLRAPVVGWCALLAASVAGMGVAMLVTGAPAATPGLVVGFVLVAVAALVLAVVAYRPLLSRGSVRAGPRPGGATPGARSHRPRRGGDAG